MEIKPKTKNIMHKIACFIDRSRLSVKVFKSKTKKKQYQLQIRSLTAIGY